MSDMSIKTHRIPTWTLGELLRKAREDSGMTQDEMAETLHVGRSTIANWENGRNRPRRIYVERWSETTGVPEWWLMGQTAERGGDACATPEYRGSPRRGRWARALQSLDHVVPA